MLPFCIKNPPDGKNAVEGTCNFSNDQSADGKDDSGLPGFLYGGGIEEVDAENTGALFSEL